MRMGIEAKNAARPAPRDDEQEFLRAFQRLIGEVFRLNGQLLATGEQLSGDLDVSPARWQTIAVLRNEPMTVADIGRRLGLRRQSVQRNVNVLRAQGLVEMQPNPRHRRASLVRLTAGGQEMMDILRERQVTLTRLFTESLGLTTADLNDLSKKLRQLREGAVAAERDEHSE